MADYLLYILGGFNVIFVIIGIFMVKYILNLNQQVNDLSRDVHGMLFLVAETHKRFGHLVPGMNELLSGVQKTSATEQSSVVKTHEIPGPNPSFHGSLPPQDDPEMNETTAPQAATMMDLVRGLAPHITAGVTGSVAGASGPQEGVEDLDADINALMGK